MILPREDLVATSQLLCAMNYWTQCLDDKCPVDVVYLDFQKAFTGPILTFTAPGHLPERPCLLLVFVTFPFAG